MISTTLYRYVRGSSLVLGVLVATLLGACTSSLSNLPAEQDVQSLTDARDAYLSTARQIKYLDPLIASLKKDAARQGLRTRADGLITRYRQQQGNVVTWSKALIALCESPTPRKVGDEWRRRADEMITARAALQQDVDQFNVDLQAAMKDQMSVVALILVAVDLSRNIIDLIDKINQMNWDASKAERMELARLLRDQIPLPDYERLAPMVPPSPNK